MQHGDDEHVGIVASQFHLFPHIVCLNVLFGFLLWAALEQFDAWVWGFRRSSGCGNTVGMLVCFVGRKLFRCKSVWPGSMAGCGCELEMTLASSAIRKNHPTKISVNFVKSPLQTVFIPRTQCNSASLPLNPKPQTRNLQFPKPRSQTPIR